MIQIKVRRSAKLTWQDVLHSEANHCWWLVTSNIWKQLRSMNVLSEIFMWKNSRNRMPSWSTTTLQSMTNTKWPNISSQSFLRNLFMVLQTLLKSMAKNFDDWVWHLSKIGEFCHIINQGPWWQMVSFTAGQKHQGAKNSWNVPDSIKFRFAKGFCAIFHYMTKLFNQDVKAGGKNISFETHGWQEKLHHCKKLILKSAFYKSMQQYNQMFIVTSLVEQE